jgi:hypothetical protein
MTHIHQKHLSPGRQLCAPTIFLLAFSAAAQTLPIQDSGPYNIHVSALPGNFQDSRVVINLQNDCITPVVVVHTTVKTNAGTRLLPAYYRDNYLTLLLHESKTVDVSVPNFTTERSLQLAVGDWNVSPTSTNILSEVHL